MSNSLLMNSNSAMKKQYGEVITLDMPFGKKLVILNSAEAIYDGFVRHADQLSARPEENRTLLTDGIYILCYICYCLIKQNNQYSLSVFWIRFEFR